MSHVLGWFLSCAVSSPHICWLPGLVNFYSLLLKMVIYNGFTHQKWWFSIVILVYQRVYHCGFGNGYLSGWCTQWSLHIRKYLDTKTAQPKENLRKKNTKQTKISTRIPDRPSPTFIVFMDLQFFFASYCGWASEILHQQVVNIPWFIGV